MTVDIDFNSLGLKELRDLQAQIDRAVSSFEDRKRRDALIAVENVAREHGFKLVDLTGSKPKRGGAIEPKYANPDDQTVTWTGRGRKPLWVVSQLNQGKSLDDLKI